MTPQELATLNGTAARAEQQAAALRRMGRSAEALAKKMDKISAEIIKATKGYDMAAEVTLQQNLARKAELFEAEAAGLVDVVVRHKMPDGEIQIMNLRTGEPA